MNLHFAWNSPLGNFILSNLVPFTPFYRPAGAAYYRICFAIFGWNPTAFRAVTFALLLANLLLIFLLARRLMASREAAVIAALVFSYHPKLRQIYMSNGAVYDVLCGTLSLLALLYYLRLRERQSHWKWWEYAALTALFVAALNAKEMAAILPAILLIYDCIYHPPQSRSTQSIARWIWNVGWFPAFLGLLSALAFWGKRRAGGVFIDAPLYAPSFTVSRFFESERKLISDLFLIPGHGVNTLEVVLIYAALFGVAALTRKKVLWFSAFFALLAPLPVIFIPYRGFFVMYLPIAGWAIFAAAAIVKGRDWLWRKLWRRPPIPEGAWQPERIVTFAAIAAVLLLGRNGDPSTSLIPHPSVSYVADTYDDIIRMNERLPRGAYILLLRCRYPDESWGPMQMMELVYRDSNLVVDRPALMKTKPDDSSYRYYDRVIDFNGRDLTVISRRMSTFQQGRLPE